MWNYKVSHWNLWIKLKYSFYEIKAREFLFLPKKNNSRMKFLGSLDASELYANACMLIRLKHRRFNKKK